MKTLLYIAILLTGFSVSAQQEAMYTQYMDNQIYINPAYAGSKEYLVVSGLHRQQWVGFKGAPVTTSINIHSPLKYKSLGLGLDVLNDKIGPLNRLNASVNFSYRLHFKNQSKLCFGIKAGMDHYTGDLAQLDNTGVDVLATNISGAITPTFGAGMYYFSPSWFVGVGVPRITANLSGRVAGLDDARHLFFIGGTVFSIAEKWKLRPSTQVRIATGSPLNIDASIAAIYADKFWIGANYRLKEGPGAYVQYQVAEQLKIGYAADFPLNGLRGSSIGSHEILLTYGFVSKQKGLISPRYF